MNNIVSQNFKQYETPYRFIPDVGDMIDQYQVLGELGRGSFGIVYKVRCADGSIKALKLIKLWDIIIDERKHLLKRFTREFKIGVAKSPYLVKSFDYGKKMGNPFFTMEYCEKGSLKTWCGKLGAHPDKDRIAYHILKGLQELHDRGVFHRDIKPENILITGASNAKLTDFGVAGEKTSRLTVVNLYGHAKQLFGTWAYLAPEQGKNKTAYKALDAVADIFSFGVTMFELFTGELPFAPFKIESEADLADYRRNLTEGNWENLRRKRHLLPDDWFHIIEGCLHPNFEHKRFKSVNQILLRLNYNAYDTLPVITHADDMTLTITYGEESGAVYPLKTLLNKPAKKLLTLGRKDPSVVNDIEIKESPTTYISRKHATIERWVNPDRWIIRDGQFTNGQWQNSVNKLYINSKQVGINGANLNYGDIITLGDTVLKVTILNKN